MNTRKTLLAALASGALLLSVALAAPASATPGGCSDENAGAAGQTHPRCGSDLLRVGASVNGAARVNINVGNGDCNSDTLLLIQVRANERDAHQRYLKARDAYNTAQGAYTTAKSAYESGYTAWKSANTNGTEAAYRATSEGIALYNAGVTAQNALTKAKNHLEETREADNTLNVKIQLLTGRINGVECHPVTTTPVPPPPTTDVPPPPATVIQPPPAVIVPGPTTIIEPGPSQIGQAPQGYVSAGGGADAAIVSAQS